MHRSSLDPDTAERLIQGRIAPGDAPVGFEHVSALLQAARRSATQVDNSRTATTVAAMAAAVTSAPVISSRASAAPRRSLKTKMAAGSAAGLLSLFGGLAAAGALPSAAQNGVATAASHVGLDLPRHGGGHGNGHGKGPSVKAGTNGQQPSTESTANHGACVSEAAHSTTTTSGGNHGEAVSSVARSDCGKPEQATTPTSSPGNKPVQPPGLENKPETPTPSSLPGNSGNGQSHKPVSPGSSGERTSHS